MYGPQNRKLLKMGYSQSPEEAVGGNEDLLSVILLGLPVKQLVRFKSVSKHWNSLISDPQFCRRYSLMKLSCPPSCLFFSAFEEREVIVAALDDSSPNNDSFSVRFSFMDSSDVRHNTSGYLMQTCNGLSLCRCCFCGSEDYFVCNFTTKQFNKLPRPSWIDENQNIVLAFDPSNSPHYKTVLLTSGTLYGATALRIYVYSSETGSWKPAKYSQSDALYWNVKYYEDIFWNNALYWLGEKDCWYFDMDVERMMTTAVPSYPRKLGIFSGHLHLMTQQGNTQGIHVYEMKKDHSRNPSWCLVHSIDLAPVAKADPEMNGIFKLAWGDSTAGWTLVFLADGIVIVFTEKDKTLKLFPILPSNRPGVYTDGMYNCHQQFQTLFRV